jgi:HSP20 family molecular chaperone IbpA
MAATDQLACVGPAPAQPHRRIGIRDALMAQDSMKDDYSKAQKVAGIANFAAATVLWVAGVLTVFQGISVLSDDQLIVPVPNYVYGFNLTVWGWIHIILGVLIAVVALGLFWSTTWARASAIIIASLSIVSMFLWLPRYPLWSIVVIALDIFVIWAVATWEGPQTHTSRAEVNDFVRSSAAQPQLNWRWPEASQWLGAFPSWSTGQQVSGGQPIRLEEGMKDGCYEIRAELPGIDPAKDVDVNTRDGVLTIKAQRGPGNESKGHSEFAYGTLVRSVSLPPGANEDDIAVTYARGILTVSVGMSQPRPEKKRIHVESGT